MLEFCNGGYTNGKFSKYDFRSSSWVKCNRACKYCGKILFSLDSPDPKIDSFWAQEADARVEAYQKGGIDAIPAEEVFAKYRRK